MQTVGADQSIALETAATVGHCTDRPSILFEAFDLHAGFDFDKSAGHACVQERSVQIGAMHYDIGVSESLPEFLAEGEAVDLPSGRQIHQPKRVDIYCALEKRFAH